VYGSLIASYKKVFSDHSIIVIWYTQSPIIKNGPIRKDAEILGKFKERRLKQGSFLSLVQAVRKAKQLVFRQLPGIIYILYIYFKAVSK
jgi:hypothetical protein